MVCCDGMKVMTERTTFALDRCTVGRLRRLSSAWHVSQAEVVRRAIALADASARDEPSAADSLRKLHAAGHTLVREAADSYLADVALARRSWRGGA